MAAPYGHSVLPIDARGGDTRIHHPVILRF
jgi:hypothetical protein